MTKQLISQRCKLCFFSALLVLSFATNTAFSAEPHSLFPVDLSGKSPLFVSAPQIEKDLVVFESLLRENYGLYGDMMQKGDVWETMFTQLEKELFANPTPLLTHHFQARLIEALAFTEDSTLRADLLFRKRHYLNKVNAGISFFTNVFLVLQEGNYRVSPNKTYPDLANSRLIGCSSGKQSNPVLNLSDNKGLPVFSILKKSPFHLFPVLPERDGEQRFMLGVFANEQLKFLHCNFENKFKETVNRILPLYFPEVRAETPDSPIFRFAKGGRIPYIHWAHDGDPLDPQTQEFFKLARKLQKVETLILDVRGNANGSFAFIEKWLKELSSNQWKNVIIHEKQTPMSLRGLMNRVAWEKIKGRTSSTKIQGERAQQRQQLQALLDHFEENNLESKVIETKFIFNGKKKSPKWNKRIFVLANRHCGSGCQFLSALSKQLKNGILIGSNTGVFPKNPTVPLYQLPESKILLSINHRRHLQPSGESVSPAGYEPDYWFFPSSSIQEVFRYSGSLDGL